MDPMHCRTSSFSSSSSGKTSDSKHVTDLSRANTVIPKPIQWKDVHLPEEWILEGAAPPAIPKQLEPNTKLQNVTQYSDGKVKLSFRRSASTRFSDKESCSSIPSLERKFTKVSKTSQRLVHESKSDFAKAIREKLDRIEAASSSSSKIQIAPDTPQSSKIGVLEQDQVSIASSDLEAFIEEPVSKANKIHWELALPTSKSPPDLTIDNRPSALNQARYNASSVYEWNIDGMSEYNILGVLQQMTMAANAYKTQSGTSDKAIAEILIAGFTSQLKGWWDHLLTKLQQLDIFNAIQTDENGAPILDEFNNPIQDAVATLILIISLHFIGDPSHLRDKNAELLHNLRCRKLSDFQDYKTTFFTRLFLRDDANHVTWKEKFLAGLPTLLGEKVRNSIKALYDNRIPYDELTYGELVSFVNKEGLKICQDLKLQKRLKQELRRSKQELGSFCKQFNYDPFKASTSKDCNGKCSSKPYKKHYKSKSHRKPFHDFKKLPYKKPSRPYKKHSFSKKKEFKAKPKTPFNFKDATCFKCGMKGHTAKFCRMNKRLQELDLNEDILSKIAPLLIESSDSESSMSGDSDPLQVDELLDSDTSASSSNGSDSDSYLKKNNVLTKDQEIFLELVKHISDPNLQKDYLDKLLKTMDSDKAGTSAEISKIMPPKKNKGKAILKDTGSQEPFKESLSTPSKEKLLSSALPIKSWIELVEEYGSQYKSISSDDQVKQWMSSITKSPELMLALQNLSQSQNSPKEEIEITKPSSQNVVVSAESSSSQIVLSQPTPSKKTSDWFDKTHFQNILSLEDGFYHSDPFQSISKFFPKGWFFKPWDLTKPQSYYQSILEITESVKFKHFFLAKAHSEPAYSTATILKKKDFPPFFAFVQISSYHGSVRGTSASTSKIPKSSFKEPLKSNGGQNLMNSAKTEDEYFKAMEQLLASRSKSSVADSSEDEDDDEDEEPFISLGDENEDDCFGIFSPVKHCK
ncbi:hypothetical protein KPL70_011491 [Citrus sinensis]|nr:hypothetical protein KPL70_011491 [Citrus sinensis]